MLEKESGTNLLPGSPCPPRNKQFDTLELPARGAYGVEVHRAEYHDIADFATIVQSRIGEVAKASTIHRIAYHHPDNIWVIRDDRTCATIGCYAQIMLTQKGHVALFDGTFDGLEPDYCHCANEEDDIASIYTWAVMAPGRAALGVTLMSKVLSAPKYRLLDLYTIPVTEDGRRSIQSIGYRHCNEDAPDNLYVYRRLPPKETTTRIS